MELDEHIWYYAQAEPTDEQIGEILRAAYQLKRALEAPSEEALYCLSPTLPPLLIKLRQALSE